MAYLFCYTITSNKRGGLCQKLSAFFIIQQQFFCFAISWAQDNDFQNSEFDQANNIDRVVTYGRAEQLIGTAESASDGVVGYDDFTTRPLLRVGELVEVIPGMVATQHSG